MRHRALPDTAGDRHGAPERVRAPHRHAAFKLKGSPIDFRSGCMGLISASAVPPTPSCRDVADNRLAAFVDVDMLDPHRLIAKSSPRTYGWINADRVCVNL